VSAVGQDLLETAPALAFLCLGVPYAALLDRLGAFDAFVSWMAARRGSVSLVSIWFLSAAVTALLNLDTTIVLLTPITVRLARRCDRDPLSVAVIPLLLTGLASSFLPVSNLTTLIVQGRTGIDTADVVSTLGPASATAVVVGWLLYRRRGAPPLQVTDAGSVDGRALKVGCLVIAVTVVGFVMGSSVGVPPWVVLLIVDALLAALLRWFPWRQVPAATALVIGVAVALVSWSGIGVGEWMSGNGVGPTVASAGIGAGLANLINNLPATLVGLGGAAPVGTGGMTDGMWGWLWGVNAGSLLLPWGTLATVLWWRVLRSEDVDVDIRRYWKAVVPVALPAFVAGGAVLVITLVAR
jgi:arsenical pump membrane protein